MTESSCAIGANVIGTKLAPYNPSSVEVVNLALDMLDIQSGDIFYDLGCGDGRLLVEVRMLNFLCYLFNRSKLF